MVKGNNEKNTFFLFRIANKLVPGKLDLLACIAHSIHFSCDFLLAPDMVHFDMNTVQVVMNIIRFVWM